MSFDLSALTLTVNTKSLDEAITKLDKLQQATKQVEQEVKKQGKSSKDVSDQQAKAADKTEKLIEKLRQTHADLSNEFTRGESSVLRFARSLGASDVQMQTIIKHLQDIKKLTKDPFDDSIGSIRRIQREYEELTNRANLLEKGFKLSTKQLREYSKLSDEIAGKMTAQKMEPLGKDSAVYTERLAAAQKEYLQYVQQVSSMQQKEAPVTKGTTASAAKEMDQHVLMYRKHQVELEKLNTTQEAHVIAFYKSEQRKQKELERTAKVAADSYKEMDQHVLMYRRNEAQMERSAERSLSRSREALDRKIALDEERIRSFTSGTVGFDRNVTTTQVLKESFGGKRLDQLGLDDIKKVDYRVNQLQKLHEIQTGLAKSGKEMQFAMRQVPMQITDIVVSLAGGQHPMQVFLQQGGQLKDLFGGVKEAAVALGNGLKDALVSGFSLLATPVGLAVASLALFGTAIWSALDRIESFNKQLILMGSTARVALSDVKESARDLADSTSTSLSKAGSAFIELSKAAQVTGQPLKEITTAALNLEKYGGQSVSETAKAIAKLREDPLGAMVALNKETGFLNTLLVAQANEFVNSGEKSKAAALLIKEYIKQQDEMAKKLKENKGEFATLFTFIKDGTTSVFEKIGDMSLNVIDRMAEPLNSLLGAIDKVNKATPGKNPSWATGGTLSLGQAAQAKGSTRATNLQNLVEFANRYNEKSKLVQTRSEVDAWIKSLSEEDRRANASIIAAAKASPEYSGISKSDNNKAETERKRLQDLAANLNLQGSTLSSYSSDYLKKFNDIKNLFESKKITPEAYAVALDELEKSQGWYKQYQAAEQQKKAISDINIDIKEQIDLQKMQIENQTKGLALTEEERLVRDQLAKLEENRLKTLSNIEQRSGLTPEQKALLRDRANNEFETARTDIEQATRKMYSETHSFSAGWDKAFKSYTDDAKQAAMFGEQAFSRMTDGMTDAIMQFVTTGKINFKGFADSLIAEIMRIQIRMMAAKLVGEAGSSGGGWLSGLASIGMALWGGSSSGNAGGYDQIGGSGGAYSDAGFAAKGAYFNGASSNFSMFAKGGTFTNSIVSSPTPFKFANGAKFGLMGEAGPEAIMPLSRDSSGRLGVVANGGSSGDVQIVVNNMGTATEVTQKTETVDSRGNRRIELTLAEAVAKEQTRPGSQMYNATRRTFGLNPALVQR